MNIWYAICDALPIEMLHWGFMKNALLAILIMAPLFGLLSTMVVTGRMSFFSDALGHSAFTGIAIGCICGISAPVWAAVIFSVLFALLFSFVRSRSNHAADTLIGVFSSTAVALGIFVATLGGDSFTKYNQYLIGDILSITPAQIGILAELNGCTPLTIRKVLREAGIDDHEGDEKPRFTLHEVEEAAEENEETPEDFVTDDGIAVSSGPFYRAEAILALTDPHDSDAIKERALELVLELVKEAAVATLFGR